MDLALYMVISLLQYTLHFDGAIVFMYTVQIFGFHKVLYFCAAAVVCEFRVRRPCLLYDTFYISIYLL